MVAEGTHRTWSSSLLVASALCLKPQASVTVHPHPARAAALKQIIALLRDPARHCEYLRGPCDEGT
jgi:hypothetical protein